MPELVNIRKFGSCYIAIRDPKPSDLAAMKDKIRLNQTTWVDPDYGIRSFDKYRGLFGTSIYLISNRFHYEKKGDNIVIDQDWPIFTINYSVERVPAGVKNPVFSFWQDPIPRSDTSKAITVFGPLIKDDADIRIDPLAFGFQATPKTLYLALQVATELGITNIRMFDFNADHPVNQRLINGSLKETTFAHIPIDFGHDLRLD